MSKADFLDRLDADRRRLLATLEGMQPARMTAACAIGDWSVKDLLGHMAGWEWEAVHAVGQVLAGERPALLDIESFDAFNAAQVALRRDRSLDDVLGELHQARQELVQALDQLSDDQLEETSAFPALNGHSLRGLLDWHHDRHHQPELQAWRLAETALPAQSTYLRLGAHMSIADGIGQALSRGHSIGCQSIQLFTKNQMQWRVKPLVVDEVQQFKMQQAATGIFPVVAHDSYLINLGTPDDEMWNKSLEAFIVELERCALLGITYLVIHPGAHMGSGEEAGLRRIAEALNRAHATTPDAGVVTLLETTAGQGTNLGHRFEHLAAIRDHLVEQHRVAVCFDTCHAFAAGYDLRTPDAYAITVAEFERLLGRDLLRCFHLNDSKRGLGSRVDRHEHIGHGQLGLEAFRLLINDARFAGLPGLLETPKGPEMLEDVENLRVLRSLAG
jgi:deoxyribonuclease-4